MKEEVIAFLREQGLLGENSTEFVISFPGKTVILNDVMEKFAEQQQQEFAVGLKAVLKLTVQISETLVNGKNRRAAYELGKFNGKLKSEIESKYPELVYEKMSSDPFDDGDEMETKPPRKRVNKNGF